MTGFFGYAVSVPGNGHIRRELPCQDASGVWFSPRPVAIVCDGRGSAKLSHLGAQAAVKAFRSQCAVLESMLRTILDGRKRNHWLWKQFCTLIIRTVCQQKIELAEKYGLPESEFDFTIAFAVWGTRRIGCFQVGDGAIVLHDGEESKTVFRPQKGEFDNQTSFLRPGDELKGKYQEKLLDVDKVKGIAITSDGPEFLMFELQTMTPGPIFEKLFADLESGTLTRQDILDYLTGSRWTRDPRGNDDRSMVIFSNGNRKE